MPNGSLDDVKGSSDYEPSGTPVVLDEEPTVEIVEEKEPESQTDMYDLPDGRKVDAKGLQAEYQKILPEFTRKSQELAEFKKTKPEQVVKAEPEPWEKEGWQPKTWKEQMEATARLTEQRLDPLLARIRQQEQKEQATAQAISAAEAEMTSIKESDPRVNEDLIYKTATKYNTSLTAAHQFLKDLKENEKSVEQRVLKNLKTREGDNVGLNTPGSETDDTPSYDSIHGFKNTLSAARAAYRSLRK
jgi:hypothetical protein